MSNQQNSQHRRFKRSPQKPKSKKTTKSTSTLGNSNRSPHVTIGTQAPMYRALKPSVYTRVLKYESSLATTGAQNFIQNCYYIYSPYAKTSVLAGSITVNGGPGSSLANLYDVFAQFRVRTIAFTFTAVMSTTLALPSIYCALLPETSPNGVGNSANTSLVASAANSFVIDSHFSCSFAYNIPWPSSVSYIGANTTVGGWLPSVGQVIPVTTNPGVIAFSCGDTLFSAPLGTVLGTLIVEYVMDFKTAE